MSIASGAPAAPKPSATRSVSSRRKITDRCARSNVSSVAASCGSARKVSIITRLLRRETNGAGENAGILLRRWNRNRLEIPRAAAATPRNATAGDGRVDSLPLADRGEDRAEISDSANGADEVSRRARGRISYRNRCPRSESALRYKGI